MPSAPTGLAPTTPTWRSSQIYAVSALPRATAPIKRLLPAVPPVTVQESAGLGGDVISAVETAVKFPEMEVHAGTIININKAGAEIVEECCRYRRPLHHDDGFWVGDFKEVEQTRYRCVTLHNFV